ncbi:MAG: divalent metal cation transporter, partial [Desulfobacteraceae bacterium]|nr:divalent metal cation transporter [Desulfobacteraceae bacterium]
DFGLNVLWIFIPTMVLLIMVQEMVNRMGVVTGQGLSDMIRERFGVKWTFYLMLLVLGTNFGNVMAEFAGIAAAGELFGLPPLLTVPACALLVWLLVLKGTYKSVEKIFLVACLFYAAYPITFLILRPDPGEIGQALVRPWLEYSPPYLAMLIGIIGTTIAPWMQFYQQASVAEKSIALQDYGYSRLDTILGCVVVNIVAVCIVVVCALTLNKAGIRINDAADAARSLAPFAGQASAYLFAFGLWNASLFAASILPLSTSYTICEALGWESGVDKNFETAPQFYVLYTAIITVGATIILIPGISMVKVMFWSQVINGLLLPIVLVFILLLVNDVQIMGNYRNSRAYNVVCWVSNTLIAAASITYVASLFAG